MTRGETVQTFYHRAKCAIATVSCLSVRPSVCNVDVSWPHFAFDCMCVCAFSFCFFFDFLLPIFLYFVTIQRPLLSLRSGGCVSCICCPRCLKFIAFVAFFLRLLRTLRRWRSQDLVVVGALEGEVWGGFPSSQGGVYSSENFQIFGVKMTCFGDFLVLF